MTRRSRIETLTLAAAFAGLALLPSVHGLSGPLPNTILKILIYAIMALGLNVVLGYTGQLDLGFVTFMATGAVLTAAANVAVRDPASGAILIPVGGRSIAGGEHLLHFTGAYPLILLVAGLVCALLGVLRGIPTLKLTGDYYAIVTLGIAEIIYIYYRNAAWTGGPQSLAMNPVDMPTLLGRPLYYDSPAFYYLVLGLAALAVLASIRLRDSRSGRALSAIRLDPTAAASVGIDVARHKMVAFAVSGFLGGIGGSLFAVWSTSFSAIGVEVWESILLVCCIVLGGIGSVRGTLLGAMVLVALGEVLREELPKASLSRGLYWEQWPQEARFLFYGIILVVLMRFRPMGVLPERQAAAPLDPQDERRLREQACDLFRIGDGQSAARPAGGDEGRR